MSEPAHTTRKDGSPTLDRRGYSWPPFEPGNTAALRHGAYSERVIGPRAAELVEQATTDCHWLTPADRPAVWAWARAEAQVQLLTEYLAKAGEAAGDGVGDLDAERVRSAYLLLHRAESRAATLRSQLGMTPLARARLGRDVAAGQVDLARLMAEESRRGGGEGEL